MKIQFASLCMILLLLSQNSYSSDTLSRDEFTGFLKSNMAKLICDDAGHVFVSCFNGMTNSQCKNTVPSITSTCIAKVQGELPAALDLQQVQLWSGKIGACVGEMYKGQHKGKFKESCTKK